MDINNSIIISAEIAEVTSEENAKRSADLLQDILDIIGFNGSVIPCEGKYKDVPEQSYLVQASSSDLILKVAHLGEKYKQDSVLVNGQDVAMLIHCPPAEADESFYTIEWHTEEPEGDYTKVLNEYFTLVPVTLH